MAYGLFYRVLPVKQGFDGAAYSFSGFGDAVFLTQIIDFYVGHFHHSFQDPVLL